MGTYLLLLIGGYFSTVLLKSGSQDPLSCQKTHLIKLNQGLYVTHNNKVKHTDPCVLESISRYLTQSICAALH